MYRQSSPPIPDCRSSPSDHFHGVDTNSHNNDTLPCNDQLPVADTTTSSAVDCSNNNTIDTCSTGVARRERPSRACTIRSSARLFAAAEAEAEAEALPVGRKLKFTRSEICEEDLLLQEQQCCSSSKIVTVLVSSPPPQQFPRWNLRSMWELASILNFLHIFRPLLNISVEFSAEEFETALMMPPNDTLSDIHIPLMKAIPPITRMALGRKTWVTVLCRKLRDWWYWVAEGEIPIVASHGAEVDIYNTLDPAIRVLILKALCDIRVEQEDIRNYIEDSIKHGVPLSAFRKERIGGDSHGISYWYEDDPVIGHRLYREFRKVEVKGEKKRNISSFLSTSYSWETVATSLDEFQDVSEKLLASKNRTEVSLGKKVKVVMLPEVEKVHKRKEKLLKKQHREALLLDNFFGVNGLAPGRFLRDRKRVTYTFDDYDRSINEAIKITKRKLPSPESSARRDSVKPEASTNGNWDEISSNFENATFSAPSPTFKHNEDMDIAEEEHQNEEFDLNRGNRRRQRPERYSAREFVEAVSDFDSDDDIVGEAVYDDEYLKKRRQRRKFSSGSDGEKDEEYRGDDDIMEEDEEEEEPEDDEFSSRVRTRRRGTRLRPVDGIQGGLRRSGRATRNPIDYRRYDISESESESCEENVRESGRNVANGEELNEAEEEGVVGRTRFLDLNEIAPGGKGEEDGNK